MSRRGLYLTASATRAAEASALSTRPKAAEEEEGARAPACCPPPCVGGEGQGKKKEKEVTVRPNKEKEKQLMGPWFGNQRLVWTAR